MSQEFFDLSSLSSSKRIRLDDGSYEYEIHNDEGILSIDIHSMHRMCRKAKPIKITIPDTIEYQIILSRCFYNHRQLIDISALSSFDTSHVITMDEMFSHCRNLVSVEPISNWDVSKVWDMRGMFHVCWRLSDIKCLSNWKVHDECALDSFYSNRSSYFFDNCPVIDLKGLGIRNDQTSIDTYLHAHFPQWLIDCHKARNY